MTTVELDKIWAVTHIQARDTIVITLQFFHFCVIADIKSGKLIIAAGQRLQILIIAHIQTCKLI